VVKRCKSTYGPSLLTLNTPFSSHLKFSPSPGVAVIRVSRPSDPTQNILIKLKDILPLYALPLIFPHVVYLKAFQKSPLRKCATHLQGVFLRSQVPSRPAMIFHQNFLGRPHTRGAALAPRWIFEKISARSIFDRGGRDSYHRVLVSGPKILQAVVGGAGETAASGWCMVDTGGRTGAAAKAWTGAGEGGGRRLGGKVVSGDGARRRPGHEHPSERMGLSLLGEAVGQDRLTHQPKP
jgi:hypothetical protein